LVYLAGKTGKLLPAAARGKYLTLQWLMFQMGAVGPFFGQVHHFLRAAKVEVPYAIERYVKEKDRVYGVLDRRLGEARYLAGDEYTIADVATYPWVARHEWHKTDLTLVPCDRRAAGRAARHGRPRLDHRCPKSCAPPSPAGWRSSSAGPTSRRRGRPCCSCTARSPAHGRLPSIFCRISPRAASPLTR